MKKSLLIIGLMTVAGCMSNAAQVSSKNSAGITYVTAKGTAPVVALTMTQTKASNHCRSMGKSSEYVNTRMLSSGATEHYYRCF